MENRESIFNSQNSRFKTNIEGESRRRHRRATKIVALENANSEVSLTDSALGKRYLQRSYARLELNEG